MVSHLGGSITRPTSTGRIAAVAGAARTAGLEF